MNFKGLCKQITKSLNGKGFVAACDDMEEIVFSMPSKSLLPLVTEIGTIPEDIPHDSSEEKLYAKMADCILARCLSGLGLKATVNRERANCADVVARSVFHGYALVGDAKTFRLSRTAKNQKDFKVKSMVDWRGDNEYALLVCPFFQYPRSHSQIFGQALDGAVSLFSWEHLAFLLAHSIRETESVNLSAVWNITKDLAQTTSVAHKNVSFMVEQDRALCRIVGIDVSELNKAFKRFKKTMIRRGNDGIAFWENRMAEIQRMSRKVAITNLLSALKLDEKIASIQKFIGFLEEGE